jgi:hypothetical protein
MAQLKARSAVLTALDLERSPVQEVTANDHIWGKVLCLQEYPFRTNDKSRHSAEPAEEVRHHPDPSAKHFAAPAPFHPPFENARQDSSAVSEE